MKVGIQVYTKDYNPRNISLGSSTGAVGTDTGYTCFDISVSGMKYDAASGSYEIEKENAAFFDGQLEIYTDEEEHTAIVSIADYYSKPEIVSYGPPTLASNASVTLSDPGIYLVSLSCDGPSGLLMIEVTGSAAPAPTPVPAGTGFTDVPANSPFKDAIAWAVEQKITNGKTTTTFGPGDTCTVSHILTFLWRAAGRPGDSGNEQDAVTAWAQGLGIDTGNLSAPCTRSAAVSYMWKAAGSPAPTKPTAFADVPADADYAQAVSWAVEKGITNGTGGDAFSPDNTCTRGQIVTFLYRAK